MILNRYQLVPYQMIYTRYGPALQQITTPQVGPIEKFVDKLQAKLTEKLDLGYPQTRPR